MNRLKSLALACTDAEVVFRGLSREVPGESDEARAARASRAESARLVLLGRLVALGVAVDEAIRAADVPAKEVTSDE